MGVRVSGSARPSAVVESVTGIQWAGIRRIKRIRSYIYEDVRSVSEQWLTEPEGWSSRQHAEQFTRESTDGQFTRYLNFYRFRCGQEDSKQIVRSSCS